MPDFSQQRPSSALKGMEMRQQTTNQLLKQAAAYVPDYNEVLDKILTYDLDSPTREKFASIAGGEVQDFVQNYRKNPFYSFSQKAKNQLQKIQSLVNSPVMANAENMYAQAKEVWKDNKDVMGEFVIDNGVIRAVNRDTNEVENIYFGDLDFEKYRPLTVAGEKSLIENKDGILGYTEKVGFPSYNLAKMSDIDNKMRLWLTKSAVGKVSTSTETDVDGGITVTTDQSDNIVGLQSRIVSFVESLSDSERNTLTSQYIKQSGGDVSEKGFGDWLVSRVTDFAEGSREPSFSQKTDQSTASKIKGFGGGAGGGVGTMALGDLILGGVTQIKDFAIDPGAGRKSDFIPMVSGYDIKLDHLINTDEENPLVEVAKGDHRKSKFFKNVSAFNLAGDLYNAKLLGSDKGFYDIATPDWKENAIINTSEDASIVQWVTDPETGQMASPEEMAEISAFMNGKKDTIDPAIASKYLTQSTTENGELKYDANSIGYFYNVGFLYPHMEGFWDKNKLGDEDLTAQFDELGIESVGDEKYMKWYRQGAGMNDDPLTKGFFGDNDEIYKGRVFIPMNPELLRPATGGDVYDSRYTFSFDNLFGEPARMSRVVKARKAVNNRFTAWQN